MATNITNVGNTRKILVAQTSLAMPGSGGASLGVFNVQRYSTIAGMVSGIGSLTLQARFGVASGNFQVSSSFVANSGPMDFTMNNRGLFAGFTITQAASQSAVILIYGQP